MPNEFPPRAGDSIEKWIAEIRDPAAKSSEGMRTLRVKDAEAGYEIAPLPDGRWAVKVHCAFRTGNIDSIATPWRAFTTRAECVDHFLDAVRNHFRESPHRLERQRKATEAISRLVSPALAFREPPALPRTEEAPDDAVERRRLEARQALKERFPLFADLIDES